MSELLYLCPSCDSDLKVQETDSVVVCPECKERISISFDADFENSRWIDCTKLSIADQ